MDHFFKSSIIFSGICAMLLGLSDICFSQTYCTPTYTSGCSSGDNISDVILEGDIAPGINNLSTPCTGGYTDFTSMSANLTVGETYIGYVTTTYSSASENVRIWIDYNKNGEFEATEEIATLTSISNSSTGEFSFVPELPIGTPVDDYRMRVRLVWSTTASTIDPCTSYSFGECHDYTVTIAPATTPDDGGVGELINPEGSFCSENNEVKVRVRNHGHNEINSILVHWAIDGNPQELYTLTTVLNPVGTSGDFTDLVLGQVDFPYNTPVEIKAWTSMPNGVTDTNFENDSLITTITATKQGIAIETLPDMDICQGSPVSVDAGEFPNSNYVWSNGELTQSIDVSESGTYWVWVYNTDGCEAKDTFEVTQLPNPVANSIQIEDLGNREFRFHIIGENFVDEYSWNFGDGSPLETGGGAKTHQFEETGTYEVEATLSNDCNDLVLSYTLTVTGGTTGIDNLKELAKLIKLYPNPASKLLHIQNESKVKMNEIKIFDILGREVFRSGKIDSQQYEVDVEGLTPGSYQVLIYTDKGIATKTVQVLNK